MFELFLKKEWFDLYNFKTQKTSYTIGINSAILFRILNTREKTQSINIVYNEDNDDKLYINFISNNKKEFEKEFEISLIDLDVESFQIPDIEYDAELSLNSTHFSTIISQLKLFGDNLDISCSEELIKLTSKSIELGKMSVNIKIEELNEFSIIEGQTLNLSFTLNTLSNICLYHKLTENILIYISKDYPLKLIYNLKNESSLIFYLAPKINEDD
jgi:proliferating cell nuclear antigen